MDGLHPTALDTRSLAPPPGATVYAGKVFHKRLAPFVHELTYRVFSVFLDIDQLAETDRENRLFSYNRAGVVSFHDRDHGPRDGKPLRPWVEAQLAARGINLDGGPIRILCFPRLWGYVFNPLSIYYCYDRSDRLSAVLYEVSNTFGEWHGYLLTVDGGAAERPGTPIRQSVDKAFHVSPFNDVSGGYRFVLQPPSNRLSFMIRQVDEKGEDLLIATHTATAAPMTDRALLGAVMRHPLLTFKVIAGIHWEAVQLWVKGARYHPKPDRPSQDVTW